MWYDIALSMVESGHFLVQDNCFCVNSQQRWRRPPLVFACILPRCLGMEPASQVSGFRV